MTLYRNGTEHESQTYRFVQTTEPMHATFQGYPPDGLYIVQVEQAESRKLLDVPTWRTAEQR